MKFRLKEVTAAVLAMFVITGCDSDNDDGGVALTEPVAAYVGNWTTGCIVAPFPGVENTFVTIDFLADTTTWEHVVSGYLDEGCTIQEQVTDGASSERGTTTVAGTYTEGNEVTTPTGLQASVLNLTVNTFTNTLNEPEDEPNNSIGNTFETLVFVDDSNALFLDNALLGINETPGTLVLTLPFNATQ